MEAMKRVWIIFLVLMILAIVALLLWITKARAPISNIGTEFQEAEEVSESSVKSTSFVFGGDMMYDRYVNHIFKNVGFNHIFDNLDKTLFADKDIAFANLEGPVSDKPITDDYPERSLVFNMPPETISTIKNLGLNGVSLANNHTLNAGASGFATTQNLLKNAGTKYGGSQNGFDDSNIVRYDTEIPISIITVDYLAFSNNAKINTVIKAEKDLDRFVIVFPHWGEEYSLTHNATQENAAKSWIDAGAELVIGSHPHVVQDVGIYNNKPIIYSLGNFVFDQTFSKDTQEGLIIGGKITETGLELTFNPIESIKLKPQLLAAKNKSAMLSRILNGAILGNNLINENTILLPR